MLIIVCYNQNKNLSFSFNSSVSICPTNTEVRSRIFQKLFKTKPSIFYLFTSKYFLFIIFFKFSYRYILFPEPSCIF